MNTTEIASSHLLQLHGSSPFSQFGIEKLLNILQAQLPELAEITAEYTYFAQTNSELDEQEEKLLLQILEAKSSSGKSGYVILVLPRLGTISPWSSKATEILQLCGITKIKRIERGIAYYLTIAKSLSHEDMQQIATHIHDKMTEIACFDTNQVKNVFQILQPKHENEIDILVEGQSALLSANKYLGLALSIDEISYLYDSYSSLQRNPTYAELMMFAQVNSEHCRHKIFNAQWTIDGLQQQYSLFAMIKNTYKQNSSGVISAYHDNGAILEGSIAEQFYCDSYTHEYKIKQHPSHIVIKVETHNHPTAIAPHPGAATGSGGEIRDEGATGIGAKPKAGLTGFSVSHLQIPNFPQPWEHAITWPNHIADSLKIMLEGPIGAASFNNEFGRPNICGYFRTFTFLEQDNSDEAIYRGYHKPIMIAGGLGTIQPEASHKKTFSTGAKIIVLGGPSMLIGLGGGAASSMGSGHSDASLDFASVQRSNPEMQRRCQEVLNACWALGEQNPILAIHDVGAGGLSNALPELVHDQDMGARFDLRAIPTADSNLSPMEIWCNESQERYVLVLDSKDVGRFTEIAHRERCPFAIVGEVSGDKNIEVFDSLFQDNPVHLPLSVLFANPPKMQRKTARKNLKETSFDVSNISLNEAIKRVLQFPCVASKSFLITIGDRSVTGLVARDQMVGPWQVPVADVAVTLNSFAEYQGEAMAMGERSPNALLNSKAAARLAVAEAITNLLAADVAKLSDIKLSANWMAAANHSQDDADLFDAVEAIAMELCPKLGICIPVGKDSLSMQMQWQQQDKKISVASPVSLIISAFAPINDARKTLTPLLDKGETELLLIDLGLGKNRLGGSALAQVFNSLGDVSADLESPDILLGFFQAITHLKQQNLILAYHDRSDGGLFTTLCEMAFASHIGITITLDLNCSNTFAALFNEELGAVIQIRKSDKPQVLNVFHEFNLAKNTISIAYPNENDAIIIEKNHEIIYQESRIQLQKLWSETSYRLQSLRDNPSCARQEFDKLLDKSDPGLNAKLTFSIEDNSFASAYIHKKIKPKVAILREQGVNGHIEMAAAFHRAGFHCIDVHMTDIISGRVTLDQFKGLVACGGFSYGDVLGAGKGWASTIALNPKAHDLFSHYFQRSDSFTLGVCNGCQMLAHLQPLIPGSELWPRFKRNLSEQFEARLTLVTIRPTPSLFFKDMAGSQLPIVVAHGEGRAEFKSKDNCQQLLANKGIPLQYVNSYGDVTENYPDNPNGSPLGIAAVTNLDGRITLMMPHPERVFRTVQHSWHPKEWHEDAPWLNIFKNARKWVD